ncbi:MAG: hypothetical protein AAGE85_12905 [Pseudomonadota bacterium]
MQHLKHPGNRWLPVKTGIVLLAAGLTACASLPEHAQEARDYRRADFENRFIDYRQRCHASGRRVVIMASGKVGMDGIPNRGDYYTCS